MGMNIGAIPSSGGVEAAIRRASNATGVDAEFLIKTARRESAMNPAAKARTSSAAGLFQFIEQTWLGTVKAHGAKHGYGQYADLIHRGSDGRWRVTTRLAWKTYAVRPRRLPSGASAPTNSGAEDGPELKRMRPPEASTACSTMP